MSNAIWQFSPLGATASVSTSAGASTAATVLSGGDCDTVLVQNSGADTIFVKFGNSTVQATTSDTPVLAGQSLYIAVWGLAVTHFAVYSATGSITVYATRGRGDEVDTQLLVSGGAAAPIQVERYDTTGSHTFDVPTDISIIYLSGCGGGGGGGGGASSAAAGGGGGGPAPCHWLLPIQVSPDTTLTVFVGSGGSGGTAAAAGANGTESYISGAGILSPIKDGSDQILLGYGLAGAAGSGTTGGNGGGAMMASTADAVYGTLNSGSAHNSRWWYTDGAIAVAYQLPICQGSGGGGNTSQNAGSRASAGMSTLNGRGLGLAGAGGATWGGGGAGGGGAYGRGGGGGSTAGAAGSSTSGYGSGGGGGSGNTGGTGGAGSNGANGFIEIWY